MMKGAVLALALSFAPALAFRFAPAGRPAAVPKPTRTKVTRAAEPTGVQVLSEIEGGNDEYNPIYEKYLKEQEGVQEVADANQGPANYSNFIDGDGFDGGDGQVGVVGDDDNALDKFTTVAVRHGMASHAGDRVASTQMDDVRSESKKTQRNAFGTFTGYAQQLEEQGMVDIDEETGEDMLAARRQQLENWRNQRELRSQQEETLTELSGYTGTEYDPRAGSESYKNLLNAGVQEDDSNWNIYKSEARANASDVLAVGLTAGPITETIQMVTQFPKPSFAEIRVENDVISYEDFVVGFTADSDMNDFQISPVAGELNRRGGDPQILSLVFKPNAPGGTRNAMIVVQTEESKWTYQIQGTVQ
jgi:hypothetical protein